MSKILHRVLHDYLQGTKEERAYKILALIALLRAEYNNMYPDRPLE